VVWSGGSNGGPGSKDCHLGSIHGGLDKGKGHLCLLASSSPHLYPPGSGSERNSILASSSTYSPNLSWIAWACQKSSACECGGRGGGVLRTGIVDPLFKFSRLGGPTMVSVLEEVAGEEAASIILVSCGIVRMA
jgi:hypothetical protein